MQAQSHASVAIDTFHIFPLLPAELRLIIWAYAVRISRRPHLLPRGPIPSQNLLITSRESRAAFLSVFTLCFYPTIRRPISPNNFPMFRGYDPNKPVSLYGDLKRDILHIGYRTTDPNLFIGENEVWLTPELRGADGIRHIAYDARYWPRDSPGFPTSMATPTSDPGPISHGFHGVKKITLMAHVVIRGIKRRNGIPGSADEGEFLRYPATHSLCDTPFFLYGATIIESAFNTADIGVGRFIYKH